MNRFLGYLAVVAIALAMHQPVGAQTNANARLSLDLIPNGGAGNQRNDGVISGTVSGQGTTIAIEVFATGVTTPLVGMQLRFDFDATLLTFVKAENSAFAFNVPQPTGTDFAVTSPVRLPSSGFLTRAEFTTATDVTGRAFSIGIASVTLSESVTSRDTLKTTSRIEFNATGPPTPDFDGDGTVGFSDFLPFAGQYGAQRGDGRYQAKYDLNSDGAIDFSDFLLFASSYGSIVPPDGGGSETVEIPDATLRFLVSAELYKTRGKAREAPITRADMATLRRINATSSRINDLTGLEFATNLTWLDLGANRISDITALAGLTKLTELDLGANRISDITALSGLTNLRDLRLGTNQLSDIAALAGLTNLRTLRLFNNQILSDITALSKLTNLTWLSLRYNQIADIAALSGLTNLTELCLSDNQISDITALSGLTNLTHLDLHYNEISDIAALSGLTNLDMLSLLGNQISDIAALSTLTNLTTLYLDRNQISDIAALSGLTNLTELWLWDNQISDIAALSGLTNLERLGLRNNPLSATSINTHIPALETRGVWVNF